MARTIGIVSLKGGVGKTSSVAALGAALAEFGKKILLVDANFSAPNLGIHFNILNPDKTLHDVLTNDLNIRDATYVISNGFHIIPAGLFDRREINPFRLRDKLKSVGGDYDLILIDSSPAMNKETLAVMLASDEIFVVTTPDYSTLATTIKAVKMAKQRGTPVSGLILNKVYGKNFELSLDEIEKVAESPILAVIPHDIEVLKAQSNFFPSVMHNPKSPGTIEYKKLAAMMIGEKYKPFIFKELFNLISPSRQDINREIFYERVFK